MLGLEDRAKVHCAFVSLDRCTAARDLALLVGLIVSAGDWTFA
jgi:hypothetical protein